MLNRSLSKPDHFVWYVGTSQASLSIAFHRAIHLRSMLNHMVESYASSPTVTYRSNRTFKWSQWTAGQEVNYHLHHQSPASPRGLLSLLVRSSSSSPWPLISPHSHIIYLVILAPVSDCQHLILVNYSGHYQATTERLCRSNSCGAAISQKDHYVALFWWGFLCRRSLSSDSFQVPELSFIRGSSAVPSACWAAA